MSQPDDQRALLQAALRRIEDLKARLERAEAGHEPIAIVGIGCRLPGGVGDPEALWRLLESETDAVGETASRWPGAVFEDPGARFAALVDHVADFDAECFGIAPREALALDPQQRLLLEVAWEALEHAGLPADRLAGAPVGVFVGIGGHDYAQSVQAQPEAGLDAYATTGLLQSMASGRVSYSFGFQGPSLSVDTACSSSLVAIHLACRSLRAGESSLALAGGVNLILTPRSMRDMARTRALSPEGRCRSFDAGASGYVRGEGCGMLVLERLSAARTAGHQVLAVIRGSAVNQDGRSTGLTQPNVLAQRDLIRAALADARVAPEQVGLIEAHGTGTPLGDPIEAAALAQVFGRPRTDGSVLQVGSIKSNLGHLETAAGVVGVIKAVLALQHQVIPRSLHVRAQNPRIDFTGMPLQLATARQAWPRAAAPRVAGISSFGMSGTNAHVVVEEAPAELAPAPSSLRERPQQVLVLSARSASGLQAQARRYAGHLAATPQPLADVAHTAAVGRRHLEERLALLAATPAEAQAALASFAAGATPAGLFTGRVPSGAAPGVACLFTGQGAQYAGMASALADEPVFAETLADAERVLDGLLPRPLRALLDDAVLLDQTHCTQPVLVALEVALFRLWRSWGIAPVAVLGHSVGAYAAAVAAGVLAFDDALRLVAERGRLMQALPQDGKMVALAVSEAVLRQALRSEPGAVSIAAINAPGQVVLSGDAAAVDAVVARLGVPASPLRTSHAFHSPLMQPMVEAFAAACRGVAFHPPQIAFVSDRSGRVAGAEVATPEYWTGHVQEPVRFADASAALAALGPAIFLEIGPRPTLLAMARRSLPDSRALWLPSLRPGVDDQRQLQESLAKLHVAGVAIDWDAVSHGRARRRVSLPAYAFERRRYWIEDTAPAAPPGLPPHPLLGPRLTGTAGPEIVFETRLAPDQPTWVGEHRIFDVPVLPASTLVELALAAGRTLMAGRPCIEQLVVERPLLLRDGQTRRVQLVLRPDGSAWRVRVQSRGDGEPDWLAHAALRIAADAGDALPAVTAGETPEPVDVAAFQRAMATRSFGYGPRFRGQAWLRRGADAVLGEAVLADAREADGYLLHPALLDCCFQPGALLLDSDDPHATYVPIGFERLRCLQPLGARVTFRLQRRPVTLEGIVEFDIELRDAGGTSVASIEGLRARRMLRDAAAPFDHWFHTLEWRPLPVAEPVPSGGSWLVVGAPGDARKALAAELRGHGQVARETDGLDLATALADAAGAVLRGVVALAPTGEVGPAPLLGSLRSALALVHDLTALPAAVRPRLFWITRGARAVAAGEAPDPVAAALWGLAAVVSLEQPELRVTTIDLDPAPAGPDVADLVAELLVADAVEDRIALRGRRRLAPRLERLAELPADTLQLRADASYLVTGGLGGLGLTLAAWLAQRGARRLVLVGRHAPADTAQPALAALRAAGVELRIERADVSQAAAVTTLIASLPDLAGVIHAAGVLDDRLLADQTAATLAAVLAPKADAAIHLAHALAGRQLDFLVFFGSASALLGAPGQAGYAAANEFLASFAVQLRGTGVPALALDWGPWARVGMAERSGANRALAAAGVSALEPRLALLSLARAVSGGAARLALLDLDAARFEAARGPSPLLRTLSGPAPVAPLLAALLAAPPGARRALLQQQVAAEVARVLGLESGSVPPERGLFELGLDSLMSLELARRLQAGFGTRLPATLAFDYPTVGALADQLARQLPALGATPVVAPAIEPAGASAEPLAVVGIGCRFPGSHGPEQFWRFLEAGGDAVREVPADRFDIERFYDPDPDAPGKIASRHGAFLDAIDRFDAGFFGISGREARSLDPQHRLLLETVWEALEDAAIAPERLAGRAVGVYVGLSSSDYSHRIAAAGSRAVEAYYGTGNSHSAAAGRISYLLGLTGPCLALDTACSSSLVAIHLAARALRAGDCELALAGGVNLILSPTPSLTFSHARMLAPDGRCKTFDAAADGYVRGEGVGVVALKRVSAALRDGDRILALVRGSAVNQDGRSSGLTVPSGPAQQAVVRAALAEAGVAPADVDHVEAHGTGTALGDPIEAGALAAVFAARPPARPLLLASVKTNIGHLEAAAGVAGLIKVVLSLQHRRIPPHLHFTTPNPHIAWRELPLQVAAYGQEWPATDHARTAGVSSFGFSGTNAHVVLEAAPAEAPPAAAAGDERPLHLLLLSARTQSALRTLAARYAARLADASDLADVCFTAGVGRARLEWRLALVAGSPTEACRALEAHAAGLPGPARVARAGAPPPLVFGFDAAVSDLAVPVLQRSGASFAAALARSPHAGAAAGVALQLAAAEMWREWGIVPSLVTGAGAGILAAMAVAGSLEPAEALRRAAAGEAADRSAPTHIPLVDAPPPGSLVLRFGATAAAELAGLPAAEDPWPSLLDALARLFVAGFGFDAAGFDRGRPRRKVALPSYPFEGERHWIDETPDPEPSPTGHPLLGARLTQPGDAVVFQTRVSSRSPAYLAEHVVFGVPVVPAVTYLQLALAAGVELLGSAAITLSAVEFAHILALPEGEERLLQVVLQPPAEPAGTWSFGVHSLPPGAVSGWELHARGALAATRAASLPALDLTAARAACPEPVPVAAFYASLARRGVALGPHFRKLGALQVGRGCALGELVPAAAAPLPSPGALDAALYHIFVGILGLDDPRRALPARIESLRWYGRPAAIRHGLARLTCDQPDLLRADVELADADGNLLAVAEGLQMGHTEAAGPTSIAGWFHGVVWRPSPPQAEADSGGRWLVLGDAAGLAPQLVAQLAAVGGCGVPIALSGLATELARGDVRGIVCLSPLETGAQAPDTPLEAQALDVTARVLDLAQALVGSAQVTPPRLCVVTRRACAVQAGEPVSGLAQAPVHGLVRVIRLEHPELQTRLIDLDGVGADVEALARELLAAGAEPEIALRDGVRLVASVAPVTLAAPERPSRLDAARSYLVTGGLGALGLECAEWLAARGARCLVLVGRRGATSVTARRRIDALEASGVRVVVERADVARPSEVSALLARLAATLPPIAGVIHAAGVLDDATLARLDRARLSKVLGPKLGAWALCQGLSATRLDFVLLFGSAAALVGSAGQANYAAANAFLDALAQHLRARGVNAFSIDWGPWAEVGMAAGRALPAGVRAIPPARGHEALDWILASGRAQTGVIARNSAAPVAVAVPAPDAGFDAVSLRETPAGERLGLVRAHLLAQVAATLQIPATQIELERSLVEQGLDSLLALDLAGRLRSDFAAAVSTADLLRNTSVAELALRLASGLEPASVVEAAAVVPAPVAAPAPVVTPAPTPDVTAAAPAAGITPEQAAALLARIDELSDAEAEALLGMIDPQPSRE